MRPFVPISRHAVTVWLAVAVCLSAAVARAQSVRARTDPLTAAYRHHLRALTASEMDGRAAGSAGGLRAIEYVEREFRAGGLRPLPGLDRSLRQPFAVADPTPITPIAEATTLRSGGARGRAFELGSAFAPFAFSPDGEVVGELVFVGYGLRIPELGHDDYARLDAPGEGPPGKGLAGKIVLALRGAPGWPNIAPDYEKHRRALKFSTKIEHAARHGAIGFLLVDRSASPTAADRTISSLAASARGESDIPAAWVSREVAEVLLGSTGRTLSDARSAFGGDAEPQTAAAGVEIDFRVRMRPRRPDLETANVVGLVVGSDPQLAEEYVVIGAHHDHIGRGEFSSLAPGGAGRVHPGADDNASGVAALLVLARQLAAAAPRRSIVFVAFGAEELGLHGSRMFLQECPVPRGAIVAMINIDMIGRATPDRLRVEGVGTAVGLPALVAEVGRAVGAEFRTRDGVAPRSDHQSFLRQKIPVLFFHSGLHDQYHRPNDVACLVRVPEAVQVVRVIAGVTREIANRDDRLEFRPDVAGRRSGK